jgi:putative ABC transport system permease protein
VTFFQTGAQLAGRPSIGAWLAYGLGSENQNLPGYVVLGNNQGIKGGPLNWHAGFLPSTYQGTLFRSSGDPLPYASILRDLVKQEAPALALDSVMTMDDRVMTSLARPRTYALLLAGFAAFALAIAGVGLFGVLSYSVAQRTREIGVRTALGAQARDIVRMVFREGLAITALGVVTGLLMSAVAARSLSTFLFGVTAFDATSFLVVPLVLAVVAVAACLVPARRAARVDPLQALRAN